MIFEVGNEVEYFTPQKNIENSLPMSPYERNLCMADKARLVTGPVVSLLRITSRKGLKYVAGSSSLRSSTWFRIERRSRKVRMRTSYSSLGKEWEPHRVLRRRAVTSMTISPWTTKIPFPGSDIFRVLWYKLDTTEKTLVRYFRVQMHVLLSYILTRNFIYKWKNLDKTGDYHDISLAHSITKHNNRSWIARCWSSS